MIAKLKGKVEEILDDSIVLDVSGVGYQVYIPLKLKDSINIDDFLNLKILHIFKQENQYLCGFQDNQEMNIFKILLDVPGIGLKSAMSVLSTLSIEEFAMAIANQEPEILCKVTGIGKKTAERIVLELKDKTLNAFKEINNKDNPNVNDAILGLISLGYQKNNIIKTVREISKKLGVNASTNDLVIQCLKELN